MIPCDAAFNGKNTYEENGRIHYRWYYPEFRGNYTLTFRFISTNSPLPQGVSLFVSSDFKGKMYLNGRELQPLKSTFAHYTFKVDEFPEKEFTLRVCSAAGKIILANTSQRHNSDSWDCAVYGYALWVEELEENHYRFHCNDVDWDDDYDDLIFDIIAEMD